MDNNVYDLMINNAAIYAKENRDDAESYNSFHISEILSICLAKDKGKIIMDIIEASKKLYPKNNEHVDNVVDVKKITQKKIEAMQKKIAEMQADLETL
jgi:hypothetical protein